MNSLRLTWLLLALNLIAGLMLITVSIDEIEPVEQQSTGRKLNIEMPGIPEYQSDSSLIYAAIIDHPLFTEGRLPEIPEEQQEVALEEETQNSNASEFKLVGIVVSPENTQALLLKPDRTVERVNLGNQIDGWELKSVDAAAVVLVKGGKNIQLELERTSKNTPRVKARAKRRIPVRARNND